MKAKIILELTKEEFLLLRSVIFNTLHRELKRPMIEVSEQRIKELTDLDNALHELTV
jgi:hypothetical protein